MQLVINHLTRMQPGYICVAGVDVETDRHIRPMLLGRLEADMLARYGGPFEIARRVELGRLTRMRERPQVENYRFHLHNVGRSENVSPEEFWALLEGLAAPRLRDIFGAWLTPRGRTSCGVAVGRGRASLGCLRVANRPRLYVRSRRGVRDQIRIRLSDGQFDVDLGVTDIRLYGGDHVTPHQPAVNRAARKLASRARSILSVGLTHAFAAAENDPPIHWLQVNNLHFADDPCWQLG